MGSNSKSMHKFSLALGVIIAITAMMAIPITNFDVVKAYSCSSSSSAAHTPGTSTSVSGSKGSCSSSSSSLSKGQIGSVGCSSELSSHCSEDVNIGAGVTTSSSSGGSQSSCSSSSASQQFASTSSQSQQGRCP